MSSCTHADCSNKMHAKTLCRKHYNQRLWEERKKQGYKSQYYKNNKDAVKLQQQEYYKKNKSEINDKNRLRYAKNKEAAAAYHRQTKYNVTTEQFNAMLSEQQNKCCICHKSFQDLSQKARHIDHNHKTGQVRGILCTNCNTLLGHAKDSINILNSAINYLTTRGVK